MKLIQDFSLKNLKTPIVAILVFFIAGDILFFFQKDNGGKTFFMMASFAVSYYAYHNLGKPQWDKFSKGILIGLAVVMFLILVMGTIKAATSDSEWDFMCFYMQGQLGLHHLNFYDPNSFKILLQNNNFNHNFSDYFKYEILNVGLLPPSITMLFFAPLASMEEHTGRIVLASLTFIFVFGNTILANLIFAKKRRSIYSFLFIFIVIMLLPGTNGTLGYNQTNFFILFSLLLTMYHINKPISGFYLALSLILKPISGLLVLFFIADKRWKQVIYFIATVMVLFSLTAFFWGFQNSIGFFYSPPTQRLPQYLYEDTINQSVLAVFNRNLKGHGLTQDMINLIYYFTAIVLIGLSYLASTRLNKINIYFSFYTFILCMLMIYPSSLAHYMIYLSPLLINFLFLKQDKKYFWIIILPALSFLRQELFLTYLILWLTLLYIGFSLSKTDSMKERLTLS